MKLPPLIGKGGSVAPTDGAGGGADELFPPAADGGEMPPFPGSGGLGDTFPPPLPPISAPLPPLGGANPAMADPFGPKRTSGSDAGSAQSGQLKAPAGESEDQQALSFQPLSQDGRQGQAAASQPLSGQKLNIRQLADSIGDVSAVALQDSSLARQRIHLEMFYKSDRQFAAFASVWQPLHIL